MIFIGSISVQVYLITQSNVYQEFYNGVSLSGSSSSHWFSSSLDFNYSSKPLWLLSTDNISARINTSILSPYTGTVSFKFIHDYTSGISINDKEKIAFS